MRTYAPITPKWINLYPPSLPLLLRAKPVFKLMAASDWPKYEVIRSSSTNDRDDEIYNYCWRPLVSTTCRIWEPIFIFMDCLSFHYRLCVNYHYLDISLRANKQLDFVWFIGDSSISSSWCPHVKGCLERMSLYLKSIIKIDQMLRILVMQERPVLSLYPLFTCWASDEAGAVGGFSLRCTVYCTPPLYCTAHSAHLFFTPWCYKEMLLCCLSWNLDIRDFRDTGSTPDLHTFLGQNFLSFSYSIFTPTPTSLLLLLPYPSTGRMFHRPPFVCLGARHSPRFHYR